MVTSLRPGRTIDPIQQEAKHGQGILPAAREQYEVRCHRHQTRDDIDPSMRLRQEHWYRFDWRASSLRTGSCDLIITTDTGAWWLGVILVAPAVLESGFLLGLPKSVPALKVIDRGDSEQEHAGTAASTLPAQIEIVWDRQAALARRRLGVRDGRRGGSSAKFGSHSAVQIGFPPARQALGFGGRDAQGGSSGMALPQPRDRRLGCNNGD
ncbi:hypothetical protein BP6252_04492 [Coleophoma cylindrospora]|uniref:Uncharacterized protein n=1 Tax=Coleophoma cylindrospora TaxID=1849047 RepID=A0A3D8S182_9HELO|nr:hypothetical protein BP6252_04492 [Coleophoma cylindrospora]